MKTTNQRGKTMKALTLILVTIMTAGLISGCSESPQNTVQPEVESKYISPQDPGNEGPATVDKRLDEIQAQLDRMEFVLADVQSNSRKLLDEFHEAFPPGLK